MYNFFVQGEEYIVSRGVLSDADDIFCLVNDDVLRKNSINSNPIKWEEHIAWYSATLKNLYVEYYTIKIKDKIEGYIYFKNMPNTNDWIVSLTLSSSLRGKGLATEILSNISPQGKAHKLLAIIKNNNIASQRAFQKAGYSLASKKIIADMAYYNYEKIL